MRVVDGSGEQPLRRRVSFQEPESHQAVPQQRVQQPAAPVQPSSWLVLEGYGGILGCPCHQHVLASCTQGEEHAWPLLAHVADALQHAESAEQQQHPEQQQQGTGTPAAAPARPTLFHGTKAPPIGLQAYVQRLAKHGKASPVCWVSALCLIRRACTGDAEGQLRVGPLTVHRLLVASLMLSAKLWDDDVFTNTFYGKVGGLPLPEVNAVELDLLVRLQGRLLVPRGELAQALHHLALGTFELHGCGPGADDSWAAEGERLQQEQGAAAVVAAGLSASVGEGVGAGQVQQAPLQACGASLQQQCQVAEPRLVGHADNERGNDQSRTSEEQQGEQCEAPVQHLQPHPHHAPGTELSGAPASPPAVAAGSRGPREVSTPGGSSRGSSLELGRRAGRRRRSSSTSGGGLGGGEEAAATMRQRQV